MRSFSVPMIRVTGKKRDRNMYRMLFPISVDMPATTSPHGTKIAAKCKFLLEEQETTLEKAGERSNTDKSTISRLINGERVVLDRMADYAKAVDVSDERYLYTNKDYKELSDQDKKDAVEVEAFSIRIGDKIFELDSEKRHWLMEHIEQLIDFELEHQ